MYHQAFYPQAQGFSNHHGPNQANFMPSHSYYYPPGPIPTHSGHNLNFTRDFDRYPTANPAFTSMPAGAHPFYDATNQHFEQQRWRPPTAKGHQQQRFHQMPAFHFQDKSTFYYMSDPMYTVDDRITVSRKSIGLFSSLFSIDSINQGPHRAEWRSTTGLRRARVQQRARTRQVRSKSTIQFRKNLQQSSDG